jgi:hypothetical protein
VEEESESTMPRCFRLCRGEVVSELRAPSRSRAGGARRDAARASDCAREFGGDLRAPSGSDAGQTSHHIRSHQGGRGTTFVHRQDHAPGSERQTSLHAVWIAPGRYGATVAPCRVGLCRGGRGRSPRPDGILREEVGGTTATLHQIAPGR